MTFILQLAEVSIKFNTKFKKLTGNKRNILTELIFMFKLIDIQIVILKKVINDISNNSYKESKKFKKFLIKKF